MCSLLCSTDVIAAVSIVKYEKQPKLFSLIFGEGILNDAVCIILFNTVHDFTVSDEEFTSWSPLMIAGDFLFLGLVSVLIGTILALLSALLLKYCRFVSTSAISESMLIFCIAYMSYSTAEIFHFSGIITMLTCGIVMAHYSWYNLSPQGKQVTSTAFQVIGFGCEAFCFAYLGITFFTYTSYEWSYELFSAMFLIVIVGRFLGSACFLQIIRCFGQTPSVTFKEASFMCFAGMIRGAIAFGLVLRLDKNLENRSVIVTTSLSLVLVTTILFGSTLGLISKCLFPEPKKTSPEIEEPLIKEEQQDFYHNLSDSMDSDSSYDNFVHPNLNPSMVTVATTAHGGKGSGVSGHHRHRYGPIKRGLKRLDEKYMSPFFIYKYNHHEMKLGDKYNEEFLKKGQQWEHSFVVQELAKSKSRKETMRGSMARPKAISGIEERNGPGFAINHGVQMDSPTDFKVRNEDDEGRLVIPSKK
jgi:hypothetical protein